MADAKKKKFILVTVDYSDSALNQDSRYGHFHQDFPPELSQRGNVKEDQYKDLIGRVDTAWHAANEGGAPVLGCCLCCAGCLTCGLLCPVFCCYVCISNKKDTNRRVAARAEIKKILDEFNGTVQGVTFTVSPTVEDMYIQIRFQDAEEEVEADDGGKGKDKNRDKAKEDEVEKEKEREKSDNEDDGDKGKGKVEDVKGTSLDGLD